MSYIIDRRLNAKNKSTVNRKRFLERYRKHIKKAVADEVSKRSITDIESTEKISISQDDVSEPVFGHGPGGEMDMVHPGNKEFAKGDRFKRPEGGSGGSGSGSASDSGEGMDEFQFQISQEEMLEFMFEDLELPNLIKRQLMGSESFKYVHGGISSVGSPNNISIIRSMRSANARRIALTSKKRKRLKAIALLLEQLREEPVTEQDVSDIKILEDEAVMLRRRIDAIPFLDDFDIRYNLNIKQPTPTSKAVMFCLMDVSGSMTQDIKDIAKRFYMLLYLFLKRNYKHIDVVFIRHHTSAKEVDEEEFFYSRETGGTIVSSALQKMREVIKDRYSPEEWNIYGAQASDGDNWGEDSSNCFNLLCEDILPHVQYYSYVEITERQHQSLWTEYERVAAKFPDYFAMQKIETAADIYPVFRELFARKEVI
ncbi:MAG: YeaH/YhbH family protein [Pseudomonadales bacterium]|nr:YeaH/YhbH family protein [Pseudomonadales bacterium]